MATPHLPPRERKSLYDFMVRPSECAVAEIDGTPWLTDRFVMVSMPWHGAMLYPGRYSLRRSSEPASGTWPLNDDLDGLAGTLGRLLARYGAITEWERLTVTDTAVYTTRSRHDADPRLRHRVTHGHTAGTVTIRDDWAERHHDTLTSGELSLWTPSSSGHPVGSGIIHVVAVATGPAQPTNVDGIAAFVMPTRANDAVTAACRH